MKYGQARDVIKTLLDLEPDNRDYLSLQATAYVGLGRHEDAIPLYRQRLAESPASPELHVLLGHSLQSLGRQKEAIESYKRL